MSNQNNELYHYGVLGMKWGRRKQRSISADSKNVKNIRKKRISEMSNQDLRDANNRLQLETQYRELSAKQNRGKRAVNTFIKTAGTITAVTAAAKVYKNIGQSAIEKIGKMVIK